MNWAQILPYLISGGTAVAGGVLGSRAAGQAAATQAAATERAAALARLTAQEQMEIFRNVFNLQSELAWPAYTMGTGAQRQLTRGMGIRVPESTFQIPERPRQLPPVSIPGGGASGTALTLGTAAARGPSSGVGDFARGAWSGGLIGGVASLVGRGRREANQIVPYQNALTAEFGRIIDGIKEREAAGTLTRQDWQTAIDTAQRLRDEFMQFTQQFGRAGQGARQTVETQLPDPQGWRQFMDQLPPGRRRGGPVKIQPYLVGEEGPEPYIEKDGDMSVVGMHGPQIFVPPEDGMILPHSSLKRLLRRQAGGPVTANWRQRYPMPPQQRPGALGVPPAAGGYSGNPWQDLIAAKQSGKPLTPGLGQALMANPNPRGGEGYVNPVQQGAMDEFGTMAGGGDPRSAFQGQPGTAGFTPKPPPKPTGFPIVQPKPNEKYPGMAGDRRPLSERMPNLDQGVLRGPSSLGPEYGGGGAPGAPANREQAEAGYQRKPEAGGWGVGAAPNLVDFRGPSSLPPSSPQYPAKPPPARGPSTWQSPQYGVPPGGPGGPPVGWGGGAPVSPPAEYSPQPRPEEQPGVLPGQQPPSDYFSDFIPQPGRGESQSLPRPNPRARQYSPSYMQLRNPYRRRRGGPVRGIRDMMMRRQEMMDHEGG